MKKQLVDGLFYQDCGILAITLAILIYSANLYSAESDYVDQAVNLEYKVIDDLEHLNYQQACDDQSMVTQLVLQTDRIELYDSAVELRNRICMMYYKKLIDLK